MNRLYVCVGAATMVGLVGACSKSSSNKSGSQSPATATSDTSSTSTSSDVVATTASDNFTTGYFTGFDGTDKFSLLLPSYRPVTIQDPSVATITTKSVTLSSTLIASMVASLVKTCPTMSSTMQTQMSTMLAKPRTIYILTPVAPGQTYLVAQSGGGGPGGGGPGGGDPGGGSSGSNVWEQGQTTPVVVTGYTTAQVQLGNTRYHNTSGTGNAKACASCHETGQDGAPSHELGDIMDINDKDSETWITTGKLNSRVASIQHTWTFASSDEETGTVAYLRTLQTDDYETLAQLEFNQQVADSGTDSKGCPMTPPTTATSTSTATLTGG